MLYYSGLFKILYYSGLFKIECCLFGEIYLRMVRFWLDVIASYLNNQSKSRKLTL